MKFICPKCSLALSVSDGGALKCAHSHSFDRSREGYYNLLLSNTSAHGDNAEMVAARRRFLATGAYMPLARRLSEAVAQTPQDAPCVLDIGCGEGYYTNVIENELALRKSSATVYGFDISKDAVRQAAKKNKRLSLAVASAYHMPFADGEFDVAVNVFSPLAIEETQRVIRTGGRFLVAIPGENHLFGLKSLLYETPYKNEVSDTALAGFKLIREEKIAYELSLSSREEISALFMMTPYAYRTKREACEKILALDSLKTEIEFVLLEYERL